MCEFSEKFPEVWICPYCALESNIEDHAVVNRNDIPTHLVYQHGWSSEGLTWERIYNRLNAVGGV